MTTEPWVPEPPPGSSAPVVEPVRWSADMFLLVSGRSAEEAAETAKRLTVMVNAALGQYEAELRPMWTSQLPEPA